MRRTTIYLFVLGVTVVIVTAMASASMVVSAQNSNKAASNMNMSKPKAKTHKKKAMGRCNSMQQEQTDLSGTYTGKAKHGDEKPVDATLTITGNDFTMNSGSETHTGRVTAVTTCGYTAVTMMMGNVAAPTSYTSAPPMNPAMSLRAKKVGNNLTLTSVPGEPNKLWFSTNGSGMGKAKPKKHKAKPKTDTGTSTKPAAPPAKKP